MTANVAVAEHHRHYIGSSQLHALTASTPRERDPILSAWETVWDFKELQAWC